MYNAIIEYREEVGFEVYPFESEIHSTPHLNIIALFASAEDAKRIRISPNQSIKDVAEEVSSISGSLSLPAWSIELKGSTYQVRPLL